MAKNKLDRYEGAMLGVAVGDALGAPLEFMSAEEIQRKHGTVREMLGGGWLHVEPGEVTDDTQMTLAVAEGIIADGSDPVIAPCLMVGANFLRWFRTHPKDVGGCCAAVLGEMNRREYVYLSDWHEAAEKHHRASNGWTAGNGALMRTVYPALYYHNPVKAQDVAANIARMTHWHKDSTDTVLLYTEAVNAIVNSDWTPAEAKSKAEAIMEGFMFGIDRSDPEPSGYSVASLVCAMNAIRDTDNFEDAVAYAVYRGGDADTIGAITGGLAGAIYGASEIPLRWINALENEPNRKTAQMFRRDQDTAGEFGNVLAMRLADLAHLAYQQK